MTISIEELAGLAIAYGRGATQRVTNPNVRAAVNATRDAAKREAIARAEELAERIVNYTPAQELARDILHSVYWPRARAVRNEMSKCSSFLREYARTKRADRPHVSEYEDATIRYFRLSALYARVNAGSARVGAFPISRRDMHAETSRFTRMAASRHFTFVGGRDRATVQVDAADILQGGFIRAIENGDTVNGVPTYGALFRHVQAERAHLTRVELANRAAFARVQFGHAPEESQQWPSATDKHAMRLIGTRNHATIDQHRASLADLHREEQRAMLDDAETHSARSIAVHALGETFASKIAPLVMRGVTVQEIADAMRLAPETVFARIQDENVGVSSGVDHSARSSAMEREAEIEAEIDAAQAEHAARLRRAELDRRIDVYANRGIRPVDVPLANSAPFTSMVPESTAERGTLTEYAYSHTTAEREYFTPEGWRHAPDVIRVAGVYFSEPVTDTSDLPETLFFGDSWGKGDGYMILSGPRR